jgi:hypothetical protein
MSLPLAMSLNSPFPFSLAEYAVSGSARLTYAKPDKHRDMPFPNPSSIFITEDVDAEPKGGPPSSTPLPRRNDHRIRGGLKIHQPARGNI